MPKRALTTLQCAARQGVALAAAVMVLHAGCKQTAGTSEAPVPTQSPQATAVPVLLASAAAALPAPVLGGDAGPPATPLRGDLAFPAAGQLMPLPTKDATYMHVEARFSALESNFPRRPETIGAAADALRKRAEVRLFIDVAYGRMLLAHSGASLLPHGSRLRARVDQLGFLLETADQDRYRIVAPGALRTLWAEGRFDVAPLTTLEAVSDASAGKFGNQKTRRVRLQGSAGSALIDIARIEGTGENGQLLLRMLEELLGGRRSSVALAADELPVRAEYKWASRGGFLFEVSSAARKSEQSAAFLACPSERASFDISLFRPSGSGLFYSIRELETLRPSEKTAEEHGDLRISSQDTQPLFVWIDGVPIAAVAPRATFELPGLRNGQYNLQLRTFLNDLAPQIQVVTVPGRFGETKNESGK